MASVSTSTPLPSISGLACQLVFLQFLNQLPIQHNITTQKDVQSCEKIFDQLLKQEICPEERDYLKLLATHMELYKSYYTSATQCTTLEERLEECKENLSTLETQVKKQKPARMVCECDAKLQEALEQTNEKRNCSRNESETINQILTTLQAISSNQSIVMASVSTSTPLHSSSALSCQLVFLQFLNQLRTQHNITTQKDVQFCVQSFELVDQLLKEEICPEERNYHTLLAKYVDLQNSYYSSATECDALEEILHEYEEKLNTLERQVEKEESARMVCERDGKLQEALEQTNERRNCSCNDNGTINQILTKLQEISSNQNIGKHIYMVESLLSLTKETIHMYATQDTTLENQRKNIQDLEKRNAQLEYSMNKLQKQQDVQNKTFEAKLQIKDDELKNKDQVLEMKDNEMKQKDDQLQLKEEDLKQKNHELKMKDNEIKLKDDQLQLKEEDLKQKNHELKMKENEIKQKDDQLQLKEEDLKQKNQVLKEKDEAAEQQTVIARKRITKVIEFTNKYRKYLASEKFNFAIALHGDTEIKDIFRPLQDIFGKTITEQEASKYGYRCENGTYIPDCFICDGIDDCGNQEDERDCNPIVFRYGSLVKPGRDWDYSKRGGDPLMLGTVVGSASPFGRTKVRWDNGNITEHRLEAGGKMELQAVAGYFCNTSNS